MTKANLDKIKFDDKGLVPVITTCAATLRPLMLAYANREAIALTASKGEAHYYSRSRNEIWHKGATSGNTQRVVSIALDCDGDTVVYRVIQKGAACHTGSPDCFFDTLVALDTVPSYDIITKNIATIKDRAVNPKEGSYTNYLLSKGVEKICKKIGEEATESVIAAIKGDRSELAEEMADLMWHMLVLCQSTGIELSDVLEVLQKRVK